MKCKKPLYLAFITLLILTSMFHTTVYAYEDTSLIILKTPGNGAHFGFDSGLQIGSGADFYFYRIEINATHLWLDKSYSPSYYTAFCISAITEDIHLKIERWFPSPINSTAQLTVSHPLSTNIEFEVHSPNFVDAYATGVVSYTYHEVNTTLSITANSDVDPIIIYPSVTETPDNIPPENYNVIITDMEGCGKWVFSEESYYTFQAQYWDGNGYADLDTVKINFSDGLSEIVAVYDQSESEWSLESGSDVVRLKAGTMTVLDANRLQVTFEIYFQNTIMDALDVDIFMWCNDTSGEIDDWEIKGTDFNIYNLGGNSEISSSGNAGRITGGDVFELYAENNGTVDSSMIFRNLQHIKLLVAISKTVDVDGEYRELEDIKYYVNYCTQDDDWITGWSFVLSFQEGYASDPEGGYGSVQMANWTIKWYNQDSLIKTETFQTFLQWVYAQGSMNITTNFWIDMWFNRENASSTFGGRVNAYYFPMRDTANPWLRWLTGSNWGVYEELKKQSMFFDTLKDAEGNTLYAQEIKLVQVGVYLNMRDSNHTQRTTLTDYDVFDLSLASTFAPFRGIQTPVFDETRVPIMPQGGFLGAIVSALMNLGRLIGEALGPAVLGFWNIFVGFMDTVFTWAGWPGGFTQIITWIQSSISWMISAFEYLIAILTVAFNFFVEVGGKSTSFLSQVVNQWIGMIRIALSFLEGAYTTGVNVWNDLGLTNWLMLAAILYPMYLLILWDEEGLEAVITQLKFVLDVLAMGAQGFISIIQMGLRLISTLVEAIPVVE